jgi:hypothetical protein
MPSYPVFNAFCPMISEQLNIAQKRRVVALEQQSNPTLADLREAISLDHFEYPSICWN